MTTEQYQTLKKHEHAITHIANGGSAYTFPFNEVYQVYLSLGRMPINEGCNNCRLDVIKEMYIELTEYERTNT